MYAWRRFVQDAPCGKEGAASGNEKMGKYGNFMPRRRIG